MDFFCVVIFKGDDRNVLKIVPKKYVLEVKDTIPYNSYVFYNPGNETDVLPASSILNQLKSDNFKEKVNGFAYKADILGSFGEYTHRFEMFDIAINFMFF